MGRCFWVFWLVGGIDRDDAVVPFWWVGFDSDYNACARVPLWPLLRVTRERSHHKSSHPIGQCRIECGDIRRPERPMPGQLPAPVSNRKEVPVMDGNQSRSAPIVPAG